MSDNNNQSPDGVEKVIQQAKGVFWFLVRLLEVLTLLSASWFISVATKNSNAVVSVIFGLLTFLVLITGYLVAVAYVGKSINWFLNKMNLLSVEPTWKSTVIIVIVGLFMALFLTIVYLWFHSQVIIFLQNVPAP